MTEMPNSGSDDVVKRIEALEVELAKLKKRVKSIDEDVSTVWDNVNRLFDWAAHVVSVLNSRGGSVTIIERQPSLWERIF